MFLIVYCFFFRYDDSLSRYVEYDILNNDNDTPAAWFVQEIKNISTEVESIFDNPKPMKPLTMEQQLGHNDATICHICEDENRPFDSNNRAASKIYDH